MQINLGNFLLNLLVEIKDEDVDLDPVVVLHKYCNESHFHIPVFVARSFSERSEKFATENGVIIFSSKDIAKLLGTKPPVFREGPIKGMVVSIKPAYLKKLIEDTPPHYYVKGGPIGKKLQKGQTLVFYSTDPDKSVSAIGEINSIDIGHPQEIWNKYGKELVLNEEEYFRFGSIKQSIVAIGLKNIEKITPIKDKELGAIIPSKDRSGSYLDDETLNKIFARKATPKTLW
jgi:predicted transcriptional regulator